ncbi:hypothetical protein U1737_14680 [Sphingomonas sp. LB3N6]|uniref:hypothetical protein n=1 Tax=Sphingomonas fucosidasi TaxID=3096164 RepID=UPI002FCBDA0F
MNRPPSIVWYERLYLASFVFGLVASAISWTQRATILAANPMLAEAHWILPVTQALTIAIALLIWYFTARRPSVIAKWMVVVFAAFGVLSILLSLGTLAMGRAVSGTTLALSVLANALYIAAAVLLFKPDAQLWFGEMPESDDDDEGSDADAIDEDTTYVR